MIIQRAEIENASDLWYYKGMKNNTKSSITLPAEEFKQVERLRKNLGAKSNVDVIRRGLRLLTEQTEREELRAAFREASLKTRENLKEELEELDSLTDEGLE